MLYLLIAVFVTSLLIVIGTSAAFTRHLEILSDFWHFSPGLLSLLGALGANIPNYVAALASVISGQIEVGIGIIIGSNIYNLAIILGIAAFASPTQHGLTLSRREAQGARQVGGFALAMMVTTVLAVGFFTWKALPGLSRQRALILSAPLLIFNLLTLGLLGALVAHGLRREPEESHALEKEDGEHTNRAEEKLSNNRRLPLRVVGETILALGIALVGVIVMVRVAETAASEIRLPPAILSLIILAVATSLPNTIVAFTLARTNRASASIEEIFSSNAVNAALGIALPLLFWSGAQNDRLLVILDGPLMIALTGAALLCLRKQRVSRVSGVLLILTYACWIALHLLFA